MEPIAQTAPTGGKLIEVKPVAAGPDVKPMRQRKPLTDAQKAALQKGRERLAERRKQMKEASHEIPSERTSTSVVPEEQKEVGEPHSDSDSDSDYEEQHTAYCVVM